MCGSVVPSPVLALVCVYEALYDLALIEEVTIPYMLQLMYMQSNMYNIHVYLWVHMYAGSFIPIQGY